MRKILLCPAGSWQAGWTRPHRNLLHLEIHVLPLKQAKFPQALAQLKAIVGIEIQQPGSGAPRRRASPTYHVED